MQTLDVMFRAERAGEFKGAVTAVFPSENFDYAGHELAGYSLDGGHCGCTLPWLHKHTRPATPDEYAETLAALCEIYEQSLGPDDPIVMLRIVHRRTGRHREEFKRNVRRSLEQLRADPAGGPWSLDARQSAAAMAIALGIWL